MNWKQGGVASYVHRYSEAAFPANLHWPLGLPCIFQCNYVYHTARVSFIRRTREGWVSAYAVGILAALSIFAMVAGIFDWLGRLFKGFLPLRLGAE